MCKQKPPVVVVRDTKRVVNQSSGPADILVVGSRACDMADEYIQGKQAKSDQCLLKSPIVRSFEYPKQSRYHQKQAYDNSDVNKPFFRRLTVIVRLRGIYIDYFKSDLQLNSSPDNMSVLTGLAVPLQVKKSGQSISQL
ncbi:hypothetical protein [Dyadobacter psychrotolerans]|uniref:Uncharacterized protein n=1 Tax=Dyadobacter psychrotolerans TaxID=2541721 RepID=A0A4R5DUD0_9BACT|nr:hypothetical protein [Dyadobacter psychrotolerans]TDE14805.1 hypothetical protein E0F88_16610 [Dyadobacter psychrotolerans]